MMRDKRLDEKTLGKQALRIINYFAKDTIDKIFEHIERLDVRDTGALRNSIRAVVHANAGGNDALVQFFYIHYAPYVENALGRYWGVDSDIPDRKGVGIHNIDVPPIQQVNYGPMTATFKGLPKAHSALRTATHRPRPFFNSEIRRQIERISYRLMRELGNNIEIHMLDLIGETLGSDVYNALLAPYGDSPRKVKVHFPDGQTQSVGGEFLGHLIAGGAV